MYIDFNISIPEEIKKRRPVAYEEMQILEKAYLEEDDFTYLTTEDSVMGHIKQCADDGVITEGQLDKLFKKYGWRV